jgi:hypothetical protein
MDKHDFKYAVPSRENIESFYNLIGAVSDQSLVAHLENIYDLAASLSESPKSTEAVSKWDAIVKMRDSLKNHLGINQEILGEVNNFLSYVPSMYIDNFLSSGKISEKIALPQHFEHACQMADYIKQPEEGTSIDSLIFCNYASGLFEFTKELVGNKDPYFVTLGYGAGRLLEEKLKEPHSDILYAEIEAIKNDYKEFRKAHFAKPRLNKKWPVEKTHFKGNRVAIDISARDFKDKNTYYKDRNTIRSLVEKLGGKVTVLSDKSAKYVISNQSTRTPKMLSEAEFSNLVKKEMPQVPLHLAPAMRSYLRFDDFRARITDTNLKAYGFSDPEISFVYLEIQDMIKAVTAGNGGIYKLTGI